MSSAVVPTVASESIEAPPELTVLEDLPLDWIHDRGSSLRRQLESADAEDPAWSTAGCASMALDREIRRRKSTFPWWNGTVEGLRVAAFQTGNPGMLEDMAFRLTSAASAAGVARDPLGLELEALIWTTDRLRRASSRAATAAVADCYEEEMLLRLRILDCLRQTGALAEYHRRLESSEGGYRPAESNELRRAAAVYLDRAGVPRVLIPCRTDAIAREVFVRHRQERIAERMCGGLTDKTLRDVQTACGEMATAGLRSLAPDGRDRLDRRVQALETVLVGAKGYRRARTAACLRSLRRRAAGFDFSVSDESTLVSGGFSERLGRAQASAVRASALALFCTADEDGPDREARLRAFWRAWRGLESEALPEVLELLPHREVVLRLRDISRALGVDRSETSEAVS